MLHRPADSRLLSNLLSHEKDYVRSLNSQLDYGQASLSSFSAYAAASPPPASRAINSVATALVGAHDALRGYVSAVEEWCEQLKMLKDLEDEVGTIARDREILVDRLIKASKANNPKRRSLLPTSSNDRQGPSSTLEHLVFSGSKLNLAQNELQACETHLTEKERLLAQMRETAIIGGLKIRCKALVECGWKWTEVGKTGLMALDASASRSSVDHNGHLPDKPLPDVHYPYQHPSSDLSSSIGPSQSASQIMHPDAASEPSQPGPSNLSGSAYQAHPPGPDFRNGSRLELELPPAHAISEEDHYIPPKARVQEPAEDELGGSSLEEEDDRQYEVHENPLFSHPLAAKVNRKKGDSKTRLPLKRSSRQNSDRAAGLSTSASAPLPTTEASNNRNYGHFGTASSTNTYSDGHQDSPRSRKRSTFLGIGALTGIFHRRERTASGPVEPSSDPFSLRSPPSPKKAGRWLTRTDKNLRKTGKDDDSSDEDVARQPVESGPVPAYLSHVSERKKLSERRPRPLGTEGETTRPKRTPSTGRKLRKASDDDTIRRVSGPEAQQISKSLSDRNDLDAKDSASKLKSPTIGNGYISPVGSPSVSRSSTVRSASTVKTSSSGRPTSIDLSSDIARNRTKPSEGGRSGRGKGHRRTTSLSHVSSPPTHGQTSLLSIVEDVTRQNRQGWLQTNPNNLLVDVKAPKSVYQILEEPLPSTSKQQTSSDTAYDRVTRPRESPLRHELINGRNSISASNSEPSLPLKRLPPTPTPLPKTPLRSALRNRSASPNPATLSPPRTASPMRSAGTSSLGSSTAAEAPSATPKDATSSSQQDNDTASLSSAYETGHEDFDSGPSTPRGQEESHTLPNGRASQANMNGAHISEEASSTAGTATPPSRRKSVRVSLKPTFSPTPPALADDEEDHSPWAAGGGAPTTGEERIQNGWITRNSEHAVWEDSSDEDEEYSRARQMLMKASRKLEKVSKRG